VITRKRKKTSAKNCKCFVLITTWSRRRRVDSSCWTRSVLCLLI